MEAAHAFLKTLAIVLGVAAITTVVFQRIRKPVVLGYIIAGLLVGPHLPLPLNADATTVTTLSELGVILLMFAIGLELNIAKLVRVAPTAGVIGVIQVALMMFAGFSVGRAFGWSQMESVFAGAAIAISSTTIIAKVFDEMKIEPRLREIVYGVLIVEDIIAILLLAAMTTVASGSGLDAKTLALTTGKLLGFLATLVTVGLLVVPRLVRFVVRLGRPETTVVTSIGICFVMAHACAAFHYSVALGAFVAGMLIAESGEGHTVEHLIVPVRDMFAAIFFVSVGMLIDPRLVIENWAAVLALTVVVITGKIVSVSLGGIVTGCGLQTSVRSGMSLAQIGEFSFIIVALGLTLNVTRPFLFPVAVAVSAITTLTTPALIRASPAAAMRVQERLPHRLTSFITLYSVWLERVRSAPASSTVTARLRRLGWLLLIDAAALMGLIAGAAVLEQRAGSAMTARFGFEGSTSRALFLSAAAVVGLPFTFGVVRISRAIGLTVAGVEGEHGVGRRAARAIAFAVQLGLVAAVATVAIAVLEPFVPTTVGLGLLASLAAVALVAFWRSAKRFDLEARAGGTAVMNVLRAQLSQKDAAGHDDKPAEPPVDSVLPGLGAPSMIRIPSHSVAVGCTLRELDLRARTGAAVLAVVREGRVTMLPDGTERLGESDVLAAVGSDEAISNARALLMASSDGKEALPA